MPLLALNSARLGSLPEALGVCAEFGPSIVSPELAAAHAAGRIIRPGRSSCPTSTATPSTSRLDSADETGGRPFFLRPPPARCAADLPSLHLSHLPRVAAVGIGT